jgi:hypothetical protein
MWRIVRQSALVYNPEKPLYTKGFPAVRSGYPSPHTLAFVTLAVKRGLPLSSQTLLWRFSAFPPWSRPRPRKVPWSGDTFSTGCG